MFLPGQEHCLRRNQRRNILWALEYKDGLAIHGTMRASSPTISYQAFSGGDLIRLSEPPVHYGMIATGNHSDSDSLRGAPPSQGKAWKTDSDRRKSLEGATPVCGSSQRHAFFASALKTERYRAVPNSQSNTDQPAHTLNAASCRYSAFRFSTSSATFRERMTLYLS